MAFFKRVVSPMLAWASVIVVGAVVAVAQDATPTAQSAAPASGQRTDGQIEMDVVHALDASEALKNDLITAATIQGEVTLSGTVSSESSKQLAESIAKGVPGVTSVKDNLRVGNPASEQNAQGAANEDNGPPESPGTPPQQPQMAPSPGQAPEQGGYGQAGPPPAYGQAPPPSYGQAPPPSYGQAPPPYGQAPPPGYGQYSQPYRPQYGQSPAVPPYKLATAPVTIPAGTLIQVRTSEPVSSKRAKGGEPVQFTLIQDVTYAGVLAIPRGATIHGVIAEVNHPESGTVKGSTELGLQLTSLDLEGQTYPLQSDLFKVKGPGKGGRTAESAFGGALLGALIGGMAGGGSGAAIGAVAGGGAGTAASAAAPATSVWIPAEALVAFHLATPVTVNPVSREEAMRLAQGLYQGGPNLYRRGYYGAPRYGYYTGYGYSPYAYPYAYPPVYYRPYYMMGGFYYWR